jgi:hypothetical protein
MISLHYGHAPGHVRDMFLEAIEAYRAWQPGEPEPKIEFEVRYRPRLISISQACGLLWNCTDILPGAEVDALDGLPLRQRTYAAAARAMKKSLEERS